MATEIIPIRLDEDMFKQLVNGKTIILLTDNKKYEVRIILADIGYDIMIKHIANAMGIDWVTKNKGG